MVKDEQIAELRNKILNNPHSPLLQSFHSSRKGGVGNSIRRPCKNCSVPLCSSLVCFIRYLFVPLDFKLRLHSLVKLISNTRLNKMPINQKKCYSAAF